MGWLKNESCNAIAEWDWLKNESCNVVIELDDLRINLLMLLQNGMT